MRRFSTLLGAGLCAGLFGLNTAAQAAAEMSLTRLDCGTPQAPVPVNERFSDTFSYGDLKIQFVFSCYLIKHGDQYLLWDTGHSMTAPKVAPKVSIVDQLDKIGVKPDFMTEGAYKSAAELFMREQPSPQADEMVNWLWSCGLTRLWLTTEPRTRAQRFYEAAGWRNSGSVASGELLFERSAP